MRSKRNPIYTTKANVHMSKKSKGKVARYHIVSYHVGSRNLSLDFFDISVQRVESAKRFNVVGNVLR